jgi:hypothetical protein
MLEHRDEIGDRGDGEGVEDASVAVERGDDLALDASWSFAHGAGFKCSVRSGPFRQWI